MDKVLTFTRGTVPLLISMPHPGLELTPAVRLGLVDEALGLPDTDWHIPHLYDFATELGASTLSADYSRFVIDLNRPSDDQPLYAGATTGLFPATLFEGDPLFKEGLTPSKEERATYLEQIWTPYHDTLRQELERLRNEFGYAILFDAHSIRGHIPHLFEGRLPDFNLGTFNGKSCDLSLAERAESICAAAKARKGSEEGYSHVLNGRFKGGHITRHYGDPENHIHAVQLELAQSTYMDEIPPFTYREDLADPTRAVLQELLQGMIDWGREKYGR